MHHLLLVIIWLHVCFFALDCEILLLYPLAVSLEQIGIYGYLIAVIFFLILTLGFVIEIASGALNLTSQRSAITTRDLNLLNPSVTCCP